MLQQRIHLNHPLICLLLPVGGTLHMSVKRVLYLTFANVEVSNLVVEFRELTVISSRKRPSCPEQWGWSTRAGRVARLLFVPRMCPLCAARTLPPRPQLYAVAGVDPNQAGTRVYTLVPAQLEPTPHGTSAA